MKKAICLVSVVIFLLGCASLPKNKTPVDDSLVKLHKAKEIQCDFTKGVEIFLTDHGELAVKQEEASEDDEGGYRLLINIHPRSDSATINRYLIPVEDKDIPETEASKVQRRDYGIYFILDVDGGAIATITVFSADDVSSGYEAALSISDSSWLGKFTGIMLGSCKVIE